jgi:DNA invertase Pin-like site-specific DNA recombinase
MSKGIAIIYDRASSKKQEENYTRHDVKRIGFEIAKRYGYDTELEPRVEIKSGEDLKNRRVMLSILEDIESSKLINGVPIKAIIVPNFTRLSRDEDVLDGMFIRKTCRDNSVAVIDFNGKIYDFEKDNDQDSALIEFWFAARDKRQMLSNTMRGKKEKVLRGEYMGGGHQLGYDVVPSGKVNAKGIPMKKMVVNSEEAKLVRKITSMYAELSANKVATTLNEKGILKPVKQPWLLKDPKKTKRPWNVNDILRIVSNPVYAGWKHWAPRSNKNGEVLKFFRDMEPQMHFDPSLQIISQQEFDRVQRIRKERSRHQGKSANSDLPFTYILRCPYCGGKLGGNVRYRGKGKRLYLQHSYRCMNHYDQPKTCPKGFRVTFVATASAVIPFVVSLLRNKSQLVDMLNKAAIELSASSTIEQLEAETRAELEKTQQSIKRVTDSVADGVLLPEEAKEKLQDLRERRDRLTRDIQSFDEKKTIREDIQKAITYINGDLENALWKLAVEKPRIIARILRFIFKPQSVVVESYWDKEKTKIPVENKTTRRGKITEFELEKPFDGLLSRQETPRAASILYRLRRSSARRSRLCDPLGRAWRGTSRSRDTARPRGARGCRCPCRDR